MKEEVKQERADWGEHGKTWMLMTCQFLPSGALFSTASGHGWQSRQTFQPCCVTEEKQEIVKAFKRKLEVDNIKLRVFATGQGCEEVDM